jgi:chromosome segregation protein
LQFTKLRLTGFKSFVEQTELLIEPGLTGIVGPNGCGKSNLVEALQWVMGEASARKLRGGDMDDVIFGGTSGRPARNIATVTVSLDNSKRQAPATLNESDELEIERRIDRGKGSTYRVNGREQRARDVQILFADAASGAGSAALIGQGRIGWLINAKPSERRSLLEEAAGIGGLHARRHEAELKLSAAEANLTRLQDVAVTLVTQIERLKKQARQAERYRRLSEQLRNAEALLLHRHWLDRRARLQQAVAALETAETQVAETLAATETARTAREAAHTEIPSLRDAAMAAGQQVERLSGQLQLVEAEAKRLAQLAEDGKRRLAHLDQDLAREQQLSVEAEAALNRLAAETSDLETKLAREIVETEEAARLLAEAQRVVAAAETALSEATARNAAVLAERNALQRRRGGAEDRRQRLRKQFAEADVKARELDLLSVPPERLAEAAAAVTAAEQALAAATAEAGSAKQRLTAAHNTEQAARPPVREAEKRSITLNAEIDALKSVVSAGMGKGFAPVLDRLGVAPGLETALGAALGDDLLASLDPAAPIHWSTLAEEMTALDALPDGAKAIDDAVEAPPALARRLRRIGLVADAETGTRLQPLLKPGQQLVTRDGGAWRWDGLRLASGAPTAAAIRLAQRNRLKGLSDQRATLDAELARCQAVQRDASAALASAQQDDRGAQNTVQRAGVTLATARQSQNNLTQQHAQAQLRRQAAEEARERLRQELAEAEAQCAEIERETAALPDPGTDQAALAVKRNELTILRETESQHRRTLDRLTRDAAAGKARLGAVAIESQAWRQRTGNAAEHCRTLIERRAALIEEAAALAERPQDLAAEKAQLTETIAAARMAAAAEAGRLRQAELAATAADRALEAATTKHGTAREQRVRAESLHEQAQEALTAASAAARANFDCPSEHLPRVAGIPPGATDDTAAELEARFEKLKRDRDAIGPVNLMAESEVAQLTEEHTTIITESADLVAAIAKFRQAIQQINREGSERLRQAFDVVNTHFKELFARLFGGGTAHLELTQDPNDPFAGGLEIMASPPGKKMQILSLLSGGERALTALALIFAVFLTNPAPISVLDEADAPLDDANVERFCNLVRDISGRTSTRFLVITHHRVSMAAMDRLYGVTMMEKGVSRLVSVELATAEKLRQTA